MASIAPHQPEMLALAPSHELDPKFQPWQPATANHFVCATDTPYNRWVETFLEEGVFLEFDDDQRLPAQLPAQLDGYRCIMISSDRKAEFQSGPNADRLNEFRRMGGYVHFAPATLDLARPIRGSVHRVIASSNLTLHHPGLIQKLQAIPDDRLLNWWRSSLDQQFRTLTAADAGWAWGDPGAYHLLWPAFEAAEFYQDPTLLEGAFEFIRAGLDTTRWAGSIACGKRFALQYAQKTNNPAIIQRLVGELNYGSPLDHEHAKRPWRLDGVCLNHDNYAPPGADADNPPPMIRQNAWVWPEVFGSIGDSFAYLTKVTGNPAYLQQAVRQGLTTHRWCFEPNRALWFHIGRPTGPDLRSAPWGRGIGWMIYGLRGLLEDMPENHPDRPQIIQALAQGLEGLLRHQTSYGLWCSVVDATEETSRLETCTAWMFINTYARAYWKGWLRDPRIPGMCEKAWQGLKTRLWRGLSIGHCDGTPYMLARQAYLSWPLTKFLGHGAYLAAIELQRMRRVK